MHLTQTPRPTCFRKVWVYMAKIMLAIILLHDSSQFLVSEKDYVKSKTSKVWPAELQIGVRNMVSGVHISLLLWLKVLWVEWTQKRIKKNIWENALLSEFEISVIGFSERKSRHDLESNFQKTSHKISDSPKHFVLPYGPSAKDKKQNTQIKPRNNCWKLKPGKPKWNIRLLVL